MYWLLFWSLHCEGEENNLKQSAIFGWKSGFWRDVPWSGSGSTERTYNRSRREFQEGFMINLWLTLLVEILGPSLRKQDTFTQAWHCLPKTDEFFFFLCLAWHCLPKTDEFFFFLCFSLSLFILQINRNTLFNVNCEGSGCPFFLARG